MSKKTYTPSIGRVTENDPVFRFSIGLKQSTRAELGAYAAFYKDAVGDDIERGRLIEELLKQALKDSGFAAWKKDYPEKVKAALDEAISASQSQQATAKEGGAQ